MILRDPVHGLVSFERPLEQLVVRLIDTREVQRLRRVRMLGVTSLAFPSAEHSRFAHAVGAAHVMQKFLDRIASRAGELPAAQRPSRDDEQFALAAALLHDVGHGPLSHLFEEVFADAASHESWTSALILDPASDVHQLLASYDRAAPALVERWVHGQHGKPYLAHAVSGMFDVDRCDYLLRDSYMTGARYGLFDLDWLMQSLRFAPASNGGARLAVDGSKGLPAVEGFFLARLFMYQQVYFHKAARAAEVMVRSLFARSCDLTRSGGDAGLPTVLRAMARGERVSPGAYQSLDDGTVWTTIEQWETSRDPVLSDLSRRLRKRALFKSTAFDDEDLPRAAEIVDGLNDIVRSAGFDPRYYAALDVATVSPYEEPASADEALQVVYGARPARTLSAASFLMSRLTGESLTRRRLVFPGEVRDKVHAMLGRPLHHDLPIAPSDPI